MLVLLASLSRAQDLPVFAPVPVPARDYDAVERPRRWHQFVLPYLDATAINLGLHVTTRYVLNLDWAYISHETIEANADAGWHFDENEFTVNQIGHPYQGALYYTAARTNDLTYYESLPVLLFGSWMWEQYLENEWPSINDQVTTSWSGLFMGEILWRLSSQLLDDSSWGGPRVWREIGAGLLNPVRGLDRVVTGEAWSTGPRRVLVRTEHEIAFGYDEVDLSQGLKTSHRLHYDLAYGDPYKKAVINRPFDVFDFRFEVGMGPDQERPDLSVWSTGSLAGRRFRFLGSDDNLIGLFQNYDYLETRIYQVGDAALGPGWWARYPIGERADVHLRWEVMATLMGAIDSPYALQVTERPYVMGPGATSHFELEFEFERLGHVFVETRRYWLHALSDPQGDLWLGMLRMGAHGYVWDRWGLGANLVWWDRQTFHPELVDSSDRFAGWQLQVLKGF